MHKDFAWHTVHPRRKNKHAQNTFLPFLHTYFLSLYKVSLPLFYTRGLGIVVLHVIFSSTIWFFLWFKDKYWQFSHTTLIKKKIKFYSYLRQFRMEQLQSQIWLTASSDMGKYLRISSHIRKPFLIYEFVTAPLWISSSIRKFDFLFYQCTVQ